ncbi:MAG: superoxide dismutase [Planctomycetota bacterium]
MTEQINHDTPQPIDSGTSAVSRRGALQSFGAAAGIAAVAGLTNTSRAGSILRDDQAGWDAAKGEYVLPPLPYDPAALEPHIDAETMRIHHGRHHAGYVRGLNAALRALEGVRSGDVEPGLLQNWQRKLSFHAGGHFNHALFWTGMAPAGEGGSGEASGDLRDAIDAEFGSFDKCMFHFGAAAKSVEASGWAWLVWEPVAQRLLISQMENQQKLLVPGAVPLLGIDVWEHAYYLNYQNRRGDYVDAFANIIDWPEVGRRFRVARG